MEHALLYGEYELTVDVKSRLLVPSEIRKALKPDRDGDAFFLIRGINQRLWMYPDQYYERLVTRAPADLLPGEEQVTYDLTTFALASKVEMDKQGRILIPEKQLQRAALGRDLTLVGARDHLELWDRGDWDRTRPELERRNAEIQAKAKAARMTARANDM